MTKTEVYYNKGKYKGLGFKNCLQCNKRFRIFIKRDLIRKKLCSKSCSSKNGRYLDGVWNNPIIRTKMISGMHKQKTKTQKLLKSYITEGLKRRKWYN